MPHKTSSENNIIRVGDTVIPKTIENAEYQKLVADAQLPQESIRQVSYKQASKAESDELKTKIGKMHADTISRKSGK